MEIQFLNKEREPLNPELASDAIFSCGLCLIYSYLISCLLPSPLETKFYIKEL